MTILWWWFSESSFPMGGCCFLLEISNQVCKSQSLDCRRLHLVVNASLLTKAQIVIMWLRDGTTVVRSYTSLFPSHPNFKLLLHNDKLRTTCISCQIRMEKSLTPQVSWIHNYYLLSGLNLSCSCPSSFPQHHLSNPSKEPKASTYS